MRASAICVKALNMVVNTMMMRALKYADLKTSMDICIKLNEQCLASDEV